MPTSASSSTSARTIFGQYLQTINGYPDQTTLALLKKVAASPRTTDQMVEVAWGLLGSYSGTGTSLPMPIPPSMPLSFPADHAQHLDAQREWYYVTLSLTLDNGALVSIVATFLREAIGSSTSSSTVSALDRQIFSTSIGVTIQNMPGQADVHHALPTTTLYPGSGGVTVKSGPFTLKLGRDSLIGSRDVFPLQVQIVDDGDSSVGRPPISVDVNCAATNPLFLQGKDGYVGSPGGPAFYYYSWPQQQTTGTVTIGGKSYTAKGIAWLDHQWGSNPQPVTGTPPIGWGGWSWFEFQFEGDRSLTLSFPHGALVGGKLPQSPVSGFGTYVAGATPTLLGAAMTVPIDAYVKSSNTKALYPTQWDIQTVTGPSLHVVPTVTTEPQALWFGSLVEYSEANCTAIGTLADGSVMKGVGYCESVGFEDPAQYQDRAVGFLSSRL